MSESSSEPEQGQPLSRRELRARREAEARADAEAATPADADRGSTRNEAPAMAAATAVGASGSARTGSSVADPLAALRGSDDADEPSVAASSGRAAASAPKKRRGKWWLVAFLTVIVLALGGAGLFAWNLWSSLSNIDRYDGAIVNEYEGRPEPVPVNTDGRAPMNILLLGSDTRGTGENLMTSTGERSDTIMVAHISADRKSVQVMSIMRDSWVPIAGYGDAKVNAAYSYGSIPLVTQTVEQLIGARIDHVAAIDFNGFQAMTDALGGVTVDNPNRFESSRIKGHVFEQGQITLNGEQALAFVGERYAFTDGDYQRVRNQQIYLAALLGKVLSAETLGNPLTVADLINKVGPYVAVDSGLTNEAITGLAAEMRDVRRGDVKFFTMPTSGTGMMGSQSVVFVDWTKLEYIRQAFKDDTLGQINI